MKGRTVILIIIAVTLIGVALTWFWLQDVITEYDLERAQSTEPAIEIVNKEFL